MRRCRCRHSAEEEQVEYEEREAAERREAASEGAFDWHVVVELRERGTAQRDLARSLSQEGLPARVAGAT